MANESKEFFKQKDQEEKLVHFYSEIAEGNAKPSTDYQKKFLLQLLNTKISQVEVKTARKKLLHTILRVAVMILSGTSTVLLGFKFNGQTGLSEEVSNFTLILSATITFLSGLAIFYDTENYWIRNKIMLNKLKEIRYEYVFALAGNSAIETKELKEYLSKFLSSLGDEYWEKFLKDVQK